MSTEETNRPSGAYFGWHLREGGDGFTRFDVRLNGYQASGKLSPIFQDILKLSEALSQITGLDSPQDEMNMELSGFNVAIRKEPKIVGGLASLPPEDNNPSPNARHN